jgi:hypothetical protein
MDHGGRDRQLCLFFSGTLNLHPISQFVSRFGNLFGFSLNTKIQILWVFVGEILRLVVAIFYVRIRFAVLGTTALYKQEAM